MSSHISCQFISTELSDRFGKKAVGFKVSGSVPQGDLHF